MNIYDVFISYRRSDGTETAEAVCEYLRNKGLRVFFDNKGGIEDGHRFSYQLETQVAETPHYVLIASKDVFFVQKTEDWVRQELKIALAHYKDMGERTITIVLPEGMPIPLAEELPEDLRVILEFQIISMSDPKALDRVLNAVTSVSHANLWHASHRWLENQKKQGGRFQNLEVDESLLPSAAMELPTNVVSDAFGTCDLTDTISWETKHIHLYGQGGIGKTTSLLKLMNQAYEGRGYEEAAVVPIFVELSTAPDTFGRLYQGGSSTFIRRSVYRQLRSDKSIKQVREAAVEELDSVFTQPYETVVAPLDKLLSEEVQTPQYLLLLDGLNEISTVSVEEDGSTVAQMVMGEILHLARNCPNVRIVVTSRSREPSLESALFLPLELAGVSQDVIYQYLARKNCDLNLRPEVLEILQIPLFLLMYAELSSVDGVCTQGEILHRFFAHRTADAYTMLSRVDSTDRSIRKSASAASKDRIDPSMYAFLLDFVLPEIGWYMEQKEILYIPGCFLQEVIWNVLANRGDTDVCGKIGLELFYPNATTAGVADKLINRMGKDPRQVYERIVQQLTFTLGVLQPTERGYTFAHQHIRDYFAARKYINTLTLGCYMQDIGLQDMAYEYMESVFGSRPLDLVVCRFIGEILQEHRNLPVREAQGWFMPELTGWRGLITRALEIYKNRIPGGKGIVALVDILKTVRGNLSGCDFSGLDLTACRLSGAALHTGDLEAEFSQALLCGDTLLHTGHTSYVNTVDYSSDGTYVLTGGNDGKVLRYDASNGECKQIAQLEGPVWYAKVLSDGALLTVCESRQRNQYFFGCEKLIVQRQKPETEETECKTELPNGFLQVQLSADEKLLLIRQVEVLQVLNAETLEVLQQHPLGKKDHLAVFLGNSYEILLSDGTALHALTGEQRKFLPKGEKGGYITQAAVHGSLLCTMTDEARQLVRLEVFRLKDGKLLKSFCQNWRDSDRFDYNMLNHDPRRFFNLVFSNEGKCLAMVTPNDVYIFDTKTWQLRVCLQDMMGEYINAVAFFDGNRRMAAGTLRGSVCLCETAGFTPVIYAQGIPCRVRQLDISPDKSHMVTLSSDGMLRCWDLHTGLLTAIRFVGRTMNVFLDITKDGKLVRTKHNNTPAYYTLPDLLPFRGVWVQPGYSVVTGEEQDRLYICKYGVRQYAVKGRSAYICEPYLFVEGWGENRFRACYDLETGQPLWGHSNVEHFLFAAGNDRFLLLQQTNFDTYNTELMSYDIATGDCLGRLECEFGWHERFIHNDCLYIYAGHAAEHKTRIFRLPDFEPVAELPGHIFFSKDGKWVQVEHTAKYSQGQLDIYQFRDRTPVASFDLIADELIMVEGSGRTFVPITDNCFAVCRSEEKICVYELTEGTPAQCHLIREYTIVPGLDVMNIDLSDLHPDSCMDPRQEEILRINGAIV